MKFLQKKVNKYLSFSFLFFVTLIFLFMVNYFSFNKESQEFEFTSQKINLQKPAENLQISTVIFFGDIMLDRGVEQVIKKENAGYDFPFQFVSEKIKKYDLAFANLEGSISDQGRDLGNKYSFRFNPLAGQALKNAGIDVVSLANNHIWDWGKDSLCASQGELAKYDLIGIGAGCDQEKAEKPFIKTLPNGVTVGIIAYTNLYPKFLSATANNPGVSDFDLTKIKEKILDLKQNQNVDLVFVSIHWGIEYKTRSSEQQQKIAKELIENGADIVVGHHPHVVQEIERYKNGWIIYSMGNFVFDQYFSEETMKGQAVSAEIWSDKKILLTPMPYTLNSNYQPIFD